MNESTNQDVADQHSVGSSAGLLQVGARLAELRAGQKLSLEEVAERLRLSPGIVGAIETGNEDKLPAMTFVRGYVRSYARLVKTDEQPLLSQLREAATPVISQLATRKPIRFHNTIPVGKFLMWGLILAVAIGVTSLAVQLIQKIFSSDQEQAVSPQFQLPKLNSVTQIPSVSTENQMEPAARNNTDAVDSVASVGSVNQSIAALPIAKQLVSDPSSVDVAVLDIYCKEDSWVEVTAEGKKFLSGIMQAGSSRSVSAKPPFDILLGNAPAIEIQYNSVVFDATPYQRGKVARFTLSQ